MMASNKESGLQMLVMFGELSLKLPLGEAEISNVDVQLS